MAMTWREQRLQLEGIGNRPCVTAAHTYVGCTLCELPCILAAGHPSRKAQSDAMKARLAEERRIRKLQGEKTPKTNAWRVYAPMRKQA